VSAAPAPVRIRAARPYDAAALLELKHQLDRETSFMMYEPGERDSPVRDLAAELAGLARSANSVVLLAELGDQLIGYVQAAAPSACSSTASSSTSSPWPPSSPSHFLYTRHTAPSRGRKPTSFVHGFLMVAQ